MSSRLAERPRLVAAAHGEARGAMRDAPLRQDCAGPPRCPKQSTPQRKKSAHAASVLELEHRLTDLLFAHHLLNGKDGDDAKTNLIEQIGKVVNQLTRDAHVG